jgi:hypothetical protein
MSMIPHVEVAFGDLAARLEKFGDDIPVPRELLVRLLDLYISCWDFDEDWYLVTYSDVRAAVKEGKFPSGWAHFRSIGYLEGRLGGEPHVDSEWYVNTYPDIAKAILEGKVVSAADHYVEFGYREGRLPRGPTIHPRWYVPRYLPSDKLADVDEHKLLRHFLREGYHQLAVPSPPR